MWCVGCEPRSIDGNMLSDDVEDATSGHEQKDEQEATQSETETTPPRGTGVYMSGSFIQPLGSGG